MELALAGVFGAGVLTFFTPCVLPLVPIYLAALVGGDIRQIETSKRGQLLTRSALFAVGFISVFSLLGLGAAHLGGFLNDHKAAVQLFGGLVILVFGLKFLGLIRIPFFDRTLRMDESKVSTQVGAVNALVMGVVFAAGWSPCVGPVLGSVLTYTASQSSDPLTGLVYLSTYGLGFAVPLFVTAALAEGGVRLIRKASRFLPVFEKVTGALLLATAATLLWGVAATSLGVGEDEHVAAAPDPTKPGELPVMVEFMSSTCAVCQRMEPLMAGLTSECSGKKVEIRQIDVSKPENQHLAKRFRLVGLPTFAFIDKEGGEVARLVGEQSEGSLRQAISALRGEPCPGVGPVPAGYPVSEGSGAACGGETIGALPAPCDGT